MIAHFYSEIRTSFMGFVRSCQVKFISCSAPYILIIMMKCIELKWSSQVFFFPLIQLLKGFLLPEVDVCQMNDSLTKSHGSSRREH